MRSGGRGLTWRGQGPQCSLEPRLTWSRPRCPWLSSCPVPFGQAEHPSRHDDRLKAAKGGPHHHHTAPKVQGGIGRRIFAEGLNLAGRQ